MREQDPKDPHSCSQGNLVERVRNFCPLEWEPGVELLQPLSEVGQLEGEGQRIDGSKTETLTSGQEQGSEFFDVSEEGRGQRAVSYSRRFGFLQQLKLYFGV